MTLPRLTIPNDAYELAWSNRRPGESIAQVIVRALRTCFGPKKQSETRPLLSWVEVVE